MARHTMRLWCSWVQMLRVMSDGKEERQRLSGVHGILQYA